MVLRAGDQALCYCFVLVLLQTCRLLRAAACCRSTQRGWRRSSTLCSALGGGGGGGGGGRSSALSGQCCGGRAKDPGGLGGRQQEGRGQITLEVVGPARQNNSFPAWHIRFGPSSKRATKRAERRGKPFWDRSVYNVLSV